SRQAAWLCDVARRAGGTAHGGLSRNRVEGCNRPRAWITGTSSGALLSQGIIHPAFAKATRPTKSGRKSNSPTYQEAQAEKQDRRAPRSDANRFHSAGEGSHRRRQGIRPDEPRPVRDRRAVVRNQTLARAKGAA